MPSPTNTIHPVSISNVDHVAVYGNDYPGIKPQLQINAGAPVSKGDVLFVDRVDERLRVTSPISGHVTSVTKGSQRGLDQIIIKADKGSAIDYDCHSSGADVERDRVVEHLLKSGLWMGLRGRPFNRIPSPDTIPNWLFVNAMDSHPQAPDPEVVINLNAEVFVLGLRIISTLALKTTFLCHSPTLQLPVTEDIPNLVAATFDGPHPAGLPGTHMHHLASVGYGQEAWSIGYQEVIAIGQLFSNGQLCSERIISLGGDAIREARLLRVPLGANCRELLAAELVEGAQVVVGSQLSVHKTIQDQEFLGRLDLQLSLMKVNGSSRRRWNPIAYGPLAWRSPKRNRLPSKRWSQDPTVGMVPSEVFERVWPFTAAPVPLLRALLSGDTETAERLGCLELAPEDLDLCSQLCPARKNYAEALTRTLEAIRDQL